MHRPCRPPPCRNDFRTADQFKAWLATRAVTQHSEQDAGRVAERLNALDAQAQSDMDRELGRQQLRVFGIRLAATLPPVALAAWLVLKRRTSRYRPFVYGFALFAANAFFFELLPDLPSYGGYVRSAVGIALTLLAGIYGVRALQAYLARKQAEADQSQTSRRDRLRTRARRHEEGHLPGLRAQREVRAKRMWTTACTAG